MITIQKAFADMLRTQEKGRWMAREHAEGITVSITCPECGAIGALDHEINDDGEVTPSVACCCGFHEHVKLEDWKA